MEAQVTTPPHTIHQITSEEEQRLFRLLDEDQDGKISLDDFFVALSARGILKDDHRIVSALEKYLKLDRRTRSPKIGEEEFINILHQAAIVKNSLTGNLAIPDFETFCNDVFEIYQATMSNQGGKVADYIPQLARVNPEQFAVSICTVDGQRFSIGDAEEKFCLQSTSKTVNYCLAIEEHGIEKVHQHVGREPSGRSFNELSLNKDGLPHNPLINAGAIMSMSLVKQGKPIADRFDHVSNTWNRLCAGQKVSFNNAVYLSERQTADRNFALAYFMRENKAFPPGTDITETLEYYFQCCSIESCSHAQSIAAATLANAGVNPLNGDQVFQEQTVKHCLSLMLSCGMYDFSGEFAFKIGLPAKSGVSGALTIVIPNLMGISIWSPRLDPHGNSVRGVEFCERLLERYNFHHFDSISNRSGKKNPRINKYASRVNQIMELIWAASNGDMQEIRRLFAEGIDLNTADYDGRTALHLAASEGKLDVVKFLIEKGVKLDVEDRWGGTPLMDAKREGHTKIASLLAG